MQTVLEVPQPIPSLPSPECICETHKLSFPAKETNDDGEDAST